MGQVDVLGEDGSVGCVCLCWFCLSTGLVRLGCRRLEMTDFPSMSPEDSDRGRLKEETSRDRFWWFRWESSVRVQVCAVRRMRVEEYRVGEEGHRHKAGHRRRRHNEGAAKQGHAKPRCNHASWTLGGGLGLSTAAEVGNVVRMAEAGVATVEVPSPTWVPRIWCGHAAQGVQHEVPPLSRTVPPCSLPP